MAFSKGKVSATEKEFKRYIGVCSVGVTAVNPNKKEQEDLFGNPVNEEPVYVTDAEDSEGNTFKRARITLILTPDAKYDIDANHFTLSFFLDNKRLKGSTSGKYQIVDKYGRFAWGTTDEIKAKEIPTYSNGAKANIDKDYRVAFVGEEALTNFIRTFLCIPNIEVWDNSQQKMVLNSSVKSEECECRLDETTIIKMFKGDFSEIKEILGYQPNNMVKVCLGVRADANTGNLYQSVYTKVFLSNGSRKPYNRLVKAIQADITYAESNGKAMNTEYSTEEIHEYSVKPTEIAPTEAQMPQTDDLPFSADSTDPFAF